MNKFLGRATIMLAAMLAVNCATYRMSEQKQKEITSAPHGTLSIKVPDGKKLDGYDEKWRLVIRVDKDEIIKDDLADGEVYAFPVRAGERDVNIMVKRAVLRPFRMSYRYEYGNVYQDEKIKIEEGKTTHVTFETPERSVSVGLIILGVIVPVVPLIGWPIGDWPSSYSDMKPAYNTAANGPAAVAEPPKKNKGK